MAIGMVLAWIGRQAPIAIRVALRDLSRYRARSGVTDPQPAISQRPIE